MTELKCNDCGKEIKEEDSKYINGSDYYVCSECYHNRDYYSCDECGKISYIGDLRNFDSEFFCESCFNDNFIECCTCGEIMRNGDDCVSDINGDSYCDSCYHDIFSRCVSCGGEFYNIDAEYIDDEIYCRECAEDKRKPTFINSKTFKENPFKRFVGVEIEIPNIPVDDMNEYLNNYGSVSKAVYDGSVSSGCEIVTPALNGDALIQELKLIEQICRENNAGMSREAGVHIHLDARDLNEKDTKKLYMGYSIFEPILYKMVAPSRRSNQYCKQINNHKILELFDKSLSRFLYGFDGGTRERYNETRYHSINVNSWFYRGTIENRIHSGTFEKEKILNWILINLKIFEFLKNADYKRIFTLKSQIKTYDHIVKKKLAVYSRKRRKKFKGKTYKGEIKNLKLELDKDRTTAENCRIALEVF